MNPFLDCRRPTGMPKMDRPMGVLGSAQRSRDEVGVKHLPQIKRPAPCSGAGRLVYGLEDADRYSFRAGFRSGCRGRVMLSFGVKSAFVVAPAFASNSPRLDTSNRWCRAFT